MTTLSQATIQIVKVGDIVEFSRKKHGVLFGEVVKVNVNSVIVDLSVMGKDNTTDHYRTVVNHKHYSIRGTKKTQTTSSESRQQTAKIGDVVEFSHKKHGRLFGKVINVKSNSVIVDLSMMGKDNKTDYYNTVVNHKHYCITKSA